MANKSAPMSCTAACETATRVAFVMAAVIASLVIGGCSKKEPTVSQFVVGLDSEVERLAPLTVRNPKTLLVSAQIYEGLLGLDEAGKVIPAIAEAWESTDNRVWKFKIRKNVEFHESSIFGSAKTRSVKAEDAKWSFTAFCGPGAFGAFLLADAIEGCMDYSTGKTPDVRGLRVIDEQTLEITLNKPEPSFIHRLTTAWMPVFPKESSDPANKDTWGLQVVVGTGPYRLDSRTESEIVLVANERYWDTVRRPNVKRLRYRVIKNDQVRAAEITNGGIDMMQVPTTVLPQFIDESGKLKSNLTERLQIKSSRTFNSHVLGFNVSKIKDSNLREAIYYGINRQQIVEKLLYGFADIAGGIVPAGMQGFVPRFTPDTLFDLARAKASLKKSSYKGEELELFVHDLAASEQIGQIVQQQLGTLGIRIKLTKLDYNGVIGKMVKGDAQMFSMNFDFAFSSPDLILFNHFHSSKRPVPNFWQYSSAKIDSKLDALLGIANIERRASESAAIEAEIMADAPVIPLFRLHTITIYSRKFANLIVNGHGHYQFEQLRPVSQ